MLFVVGVVVGAGVSPGAGVGVGAEVEVGVGVEVEVVVGVEVEVEVVVGVEVEVGVELAYMNILYYIFCKWFGHWVGDYYKYKPVKRGYFKGQYIRICRVCYRRVI